MYFRPELLLSSCIMVDIIVCSFVIAVVVLIIYMLLHKNA